LTRLFIVVAIAGLVFGEDAARGAITDQLGGLMGQQGSDLLQTAIQSASQRSSGIIAAAVDPDPPLQAGAPAPGGRIKPTR
jgi:membrane protein